MSIRAIAPRQIQVVWRCEASELDPHSFKKRHRIRGCQVWTRGKRTHGDAPLDTSGIGLTVCVANSDQELLTSIHDFLAGYEEVLQEARLIGASNTLSVLLMVPKGAAASIVEFPPAMLARLASLGVTLEIVTPRVSE
jgi:hypothetical protein